MKHLIVFIIVFVIFLGFIVLNMENKCNISFGFKELENVPVFLSSLCSFMLGMIVAFPMVFFLGGKRRRQKSPPPESGKKGGKAAAPVAPAALDEIKKEGSPYGID